jgi:PAS domain S-box-containing protein
MQKENMKPEPSALLSSPLRIVASYALYGALWIVFSDLLVVQLVPKPFLATVSIAKGWIFIAFTSLLLYHLIGRQLAKMAELTTASRENEERMTDILDGINALIYVSDLETHEILFLNKYGRDIWGEAMGKTCWKTLQSGQDGPCAFCTNDRLLTAKGVPTGVYIWEFQNTITGRWYDCRDQAIRWSDGRQVRLEIATDITERKKTEADLRLQSAALHAAANAIAITDKNGTIEWVNPAFSALTGYSEEEAIGINPRDVLKSGVHSQAFFKELWDTLLAGEVWRGEITNRHKNGTLYPEGQTITPVKDAHGEITHFIAIKRDLTEQRKLEAQLQHAQKMESIGTLAGGIAHDFNNILTAIIGYGTMALMKMAPDDPHRLHIQHMLEASDRATHLTKDLLLFSRKQAIDKKPLELNQVVTRVEKFLKRVIGEDIEVKTTLLKSPLPVLADDYQLEQVLMNLATNARDAMPHGGALTVTTSQVQLNEEFVAAQNFGTSGPYALITMTDTGGGMDETTRLRIFEPFFTTKEVGKGTGLGLAVAYGIIKQHDGYINVYSEPGTGTTFRIYLPLLTTRVGAERRAQPEEASVGGTETILLAEDDEHVRAMTRSVLTDFGYTIIEAVNGADAVSKFTAHNETVDLLLLDLIMPKMNGKEALDEIRQIRPGIKAIFSSGYAPETIQQKASLADGVHLIAKPASPTELLKKVRQVLDEG